MKRYLFTVFLLNFFITPIYSGWQIEQIHKAQDSAIEYRYVRTAHGIHFYNYRYQTYSLYHYNFSSFNTIDSVVLNPGNDPFPSGNFAYNNPVLSNGYIYLQGTDRSSPSNDKRIFRINVNEYSDTANVQAIYDSLFFGYGGNQSFAYTLMQSYNYFSKDVLVFERKTIKYFVEDDSRIYVAPIKNEKRIRSMTFINDTTLLYRYFENISNDPYYRVVTYNDNTQSFYNLIAEGALDRTVGWIHDRIINTDTIISVRSRGDEEICQVYRVRWVDGKNSEMLSYDSRHSNITSNGQGGFLLSLLDGRFYDSSFSTISPIYQFDTLDIKPRQIERVGFMDYIIFADQGVYRLYETLSVEEEVVKRSTIEDYIISDVLGKVYYRGKDPRSNLPTTQGLFFIIGNTTEMILVE